MNKKDLKLLIFATFRYSLGRRTYMPNFIVELIIKNYEIFNEKDWKQFVEEINEVEDLGDKCDIETWNKFMKFSKKQMDEIFKLREILRYEK